MDESGKGGTAGCWLLPAHATDGNESRRGIVNPAQTGQRAGKEIRRLKEENEFLEEAGAFFAASCRKSAKGRE